MLVFIIGVGRSGTFMLGHLLETEDSYVAFEEQPQWLYSISYARCFEHFPDRADIWYRTMKGCINENMAGHEHYVVKDNPDLWCAERLAVDFPDAKFLSIIREPEAVVNSMLEHPGFNQDIYFSMGYSPPLSFAGYMHNRFWDLPREGKLAWRWKRNSVEIWRLKERLGERMKVLNFNNIIGDKGGAREEIRDFLGFVGDIDVRPQEKEKWKTELTEEQINNIGEALAEYRWLMYEV